MRNILVANRGEIAWRIMRSARAHGYRTTAIYSSADAASPHVAYADQAVCVGPAPVGESYLNIARILEAARASGADAIHPGYGLLSENADFAQACHDAQLTFIGPRAETIRLMGNKRQARIAVQAHGVPCVPGYDAEDQHDDVLIREAARIGFPIMVKAAAGGGGRGMRRVSSPAELAEALTRARSEADKAFGDGRLILERAIDGARHVEVQVFADAHGHVIHLGERDCSVQRRFQKVIEEAPSPAVDAELRARMGELAVLVAKSADYLGAGTVELLLTPNGEFYFLEMNTRLQVEHPVTECVTELDLVAWQLLVAEGKPLPLAQAAIPLHGHAIEVRLYAEQPERDFRPATGRVQQLLLPSDIRIDHTLAPGLVVSPYYDALLGKLIAHGSDREQARQRLLTGLAALRVLGVPTNQAFLQRVLTHPSFVAGQATTDFLKHEPTLAQGQPASSASWAAAAVLYCNRPAQGAPYAAELSGFSNSPGLAAALVLECEGESRTLSIERHGSEFTVVHGTQRTSAVVYSCSGNACELSIDAIRTRVDCAFDADRLHLHGPDGPRTFVDLTYAPTDRGLAAGSGKAVAPMDGSVVEVRVQPGDRVESGQTLVVVEAMKLELRVAADVNGKVAEVHISRGAQVKARQLLVEIEASA